MDQVPAQTVMPSPSTGIKRTRGPLILQIFLWIWGGIVTLYSAFLLTGVNDPAIQYQEGLASKSATVGFLVFNVLFGIALLVSAWGLGRRLSWAWYLAMALMAVFLLYSLWPVFSIFGLVVSGAFIAGLWALKKHYLRQGVTTNSMQ